MKGFLIFPFFIVFLGSLHAQSANPCELNWETQTSAADNNWRSVTWGGPAGQEKFVAVAQSGTGNRVMTSADGITWETQASPVDNNWRSVTWGGPAGQEKFVAVAQSGNGNRVMTSPDGITWTTRTSAGNNDWRSVSWGGPAGQEKFVAVSQSGTGNRVMTSADGITWESQVSAANNNWYGVTWGGPVGQEKFVAVAWSGTGNRVMTSADGITWETQTTPVDNNWLSVKWGGPAGDKKFVAVATTGTGNRVMTSSDGITWTTQATPADNLWYNVTWGGLAGQEQFVAIAYSGTGNRVMTSTDGITWETQTTPADNLWRSVTWGGPAGQEKFVAVSADGIGNGVMTGFCSAALAPSTIALTGPTSVTVGETSTDITLTVVDGNGNPIAVSAETFFSLSTTDDSGTATFTPSSVTLAAGESSATFTYANSQVGDGTHTLTATRTFGDVLPGGDSDTLAISIDGLDVSTLVVDAIANQTYTGSALEPSVVVTLGATTLIAGTDYTLGYANNNDVGMATVTITGIGNYSGTQDVNFEITVKELTVNGLTGDNKTYDSTTSVTVSGTAALSGVEPGDDITLGGTPTFTFADANVAAGISITTTGYTLTGAAAGNYTLTQPTLSGDITAATLTVTGLTGEDKVYDGNTTASASGTAALSGIVGSDDVSLSGTPTFTFADPNVAAGISITTTGYTLTSADAGNYRLTQQMLSADITAISLEITAGSDSKIYDSTALTNSGSSLTNGTALVAGHTYTATVTGTQTNAGTSVNVASAAVILDGATDVTANYAITYVDGALEVTQAALTITADDQTKVIGAIDPAFKVTYSGFVPGEDESVLAGVLRFDREAGEDVGIYSITPSGLTSDNYTITYLNGVLTIANNDLEGLDITVTAIESLEYTGLPVEPTLELLHDTQPLVLGTDYTITYTNNTDAGTATVTITGIGNYSGTIEVTFEITPSPLTVAPNTGQFKFYGATDPVLMFQIIEGSLVNGASLTGSLAREAGEAVGVYNIGIGDLTAGPNYVITLTEGVTFEILSIDTDGDGVRDDFDLCPDTPAGTLVDVNGCEVFQLPVNTFSVSATAATCIGSSNGKIKITALDNGLTYLVNVTNQTQLVLSTLNQFKSEINGLAIGSYEVCIGIQGNNAFKQCFTVQITEPEPLEASSFINLDGKTVSLTMSGSKEYTVSVNGKSRVTESSEITLDLEPGMNYIEVRTDLECQGTYFEQIFVSEEVQVYPNPTMDWVQVYVGGTEKVVSMTLVDLKGNILQSGSLDVPATREVAMDLSQYPVGVYVIKLNGKNVNTSLKVIKQ